MGRFAVGSILQSQTPVELVSCLEQASGSGANSICIHAQQRSPAPALIPWRTSLKTALSSAAMTITALVVIISAAVLPTATSVSKQVSHDTLRPFTIDEAGGVRHGHDRHTVRRRSPRSAQNYLWDAG